MPSQARRGAAKNGKGGSKAMMPIMAGGPRTGVGADLQAQAAGIGSLCAFGTRNVGHPLAAGGERDGARARAVPDPSRKGVRRSCRPPHTHALLVRAQWYPRRGHSRPRRRLFSLIRDCGFQNKHRGMAAGRIGDSGDRVASMPEVEVMPEAGGDAHRGLAIRGVAEMGRVGEIAPGHDISQTRPSCLNPSTPP